MVERCRLMNGPENAIAISRGERVWIERNHMFNLGAAGVRRHDPGPGRANSCIWIARNHIQKHQQKGAGGQAGIQSHGDSSAGRVQEHFFITRNRIICEAPGGIGIGLDWANDSLIEGNVITGIVEGGRGEGIAVTGSRNRILGNRTKNTTAAGIILFATARGGNADNEIAHNLCTYAADQGIALVWGESGATISNLSVHNNRCFDEGRGSQHWGVQSYAHDGVTGFRWDGVDLHDNNLRGNVSGSYNLLLEASVLRRGNLIGPSGCDR
jgi:Right handed beta helix region